MAEYDHKSAEEKWSKTWLEKGVYEPDLEQPKKKFYNLMMFPYPSAEGLHVGNMYAFTGADVFGRYQRMQGKDVFEPIGLDGFGIHSENYAIKIGKHPAEQAKVSEQNFYRQLSMIGDGFAWNERLETYDPEYYRWTQWLFVQMFKKGLAYKGTALVNWCPSCKTVLADEQVEDSKCERCKSQVERKDAKQWFFKITEYADRLLENIPKLNWPEKIKIAQRQWIGKKEGVKVAFALEGGAETLTCFTTRIDTICGVTFLAVAPEVMKRLLGHVPSEARSQVSEYVQNALNKSEQERKVEEQHKTGINTGLLAVNPVNGESVPVYVADYILMDVGTGVVMGVPAHDQRDLEFARVHNLPVKQVISTEDWSEQQAYEGEGSLVNSGEFDGLSSSEAKKVLVKTYAKVMEKAFHYHLRDWLISRQRFWGPPIPMVECKNCGWQAVPEEQLPVLLPYIEDYKPTGEGKSPLEKASEDWLFTACPKCGGRAKRETDVSDSFLDSSWYFLRYPSLHSKTNAAKPFDPELTKTWLPVDAYIGGAEHAVLHLLYSRFVTMALKDWGHLEFEEPFPFLFGHGLIIKDGAKMSKSKGNVVNPDEYIAKFGADTLRTYLMFLGPYDQGGDFRDTGILGMYRWTQKIWGMFHTKEKFGAKTTPALKKKLHWAIKRCTQDVSRFKFNTSIAAMMEFMNLWGEAENVLAKTDAADFLKLLAPFMPFLTEELYQELQGKKQFVSIHKTLWPTYDEKLLEEAGVEMVVQVNGKVRGVLSVSAERKADKAYLVGQAKTLETVAKHLEGKEPKQVFMVPGRVINLVV